MAEFIALDIPKQEIEVARKSVLQGLKEQNLHEPDLIYRGFSYDYVNRVLECGLEDQTQLWTYGNEERALFIDPDPFWENPLSYALVRGALAVYKGSYLKRCEYALYEFLDLATKPKALLAVFLVWPNWVQLQTT